MKRDIKGIVFDIDGCVARGNKAIPGVPDTMAELRRRNIRFAFLTNDNQNTRQFLAEKLTKMGIPAHEDEVLTSAIIAARTIRELHPRKKILAFGGPGLIEALQEQDLDLLDHEQFMEAEVVVMGKDPNFCQQRLIIACKAIWNGADFVATNYDPKIPVAEGFVPATGPFIKAVAYATGKEPLVTGKPSKWSGEMAMKILDVPPENGAVVGDRLQQDIAMGKVAGLFTVLALTGGTTPEEAENPPPDLKPDLVLPDVNHLLEYLD